MVTGVQPGAIPIYDNPKTDYPRIPLYDNFAQYADWGKRLSTPHADYESAPPYAGLTLTREEGYLPEGIGEPNKNGLTHPMRLDKKSGVLHLDAHNRIEGIPAEAFAYTIGSRCALDWAVEYHKVRKLTPAKEAHHATLVNEGLDTYDWATIRAGLFDLLPRLATVSVETVKIWGGL